MKSIVQKLALIKSELTSQKGQFDFFGLLLLENSMNKWDLAMAASWISQDKTSALKLVGRKVQESLEKNEIMTLSRVVLLENEPESIDEFYQINSFSEEVFEKFNFDFLGVSVKHAYIFPCEHPVVASH